MFNQPDYQNNGIINIFFYDENGGKTPLTVNINENLSSIFWKYIKSTGKYNDKLSFLYDGKKLNQNMTVFQADIMNGSKIHVMESGSHKGEIFLLISPT